MSLRIGSPAVDDIEEDAELARSTEAPLPIDLAKQSFPNCIVWQPLPGITWFLPMIGHMGMAGSDGQIYDFSGAPFGNGRGRMMVGNVVRYVQLEPGACQKRSLDEALADANAVYQHRRHNIVLDNCHSHVAVTLGKAEYKGMPRWNMLMLGAWLFFYGKYVDGCAVVKHWLPFFIVLAGLYYLHSP
mmetsp:Transcript_103254/g.274604  ORF Transcript_103254/g.274604 Transcript_103254/m.274604 type:complete len:187 (-) Transcript_103254:357-917(-)